MQGMMVVIEGLDFVGKTTIAQCLSRQSDWLYYKTPPAAYYNVCTKLGADGKPVYSDERFWLFIECLKYSSQEIKRLIEVGTSVVVDRWLWTTLSYHFAFNSGLEARWWAAGNIESLALVHPHLSMFIHVSNKDVYVRRKESRERLTAHDKLVINDIEKSCVISQNFKRLNPSFVSIDNSGDFEETMKMVLGHIGSIEALG